MLYHPLKSEQDTPGSAVKRSRPQLDNFYRIYFDFMYFLGASPFRMVKDMSTGNYAIKTNIPQQIFCFFLTVVGFIRLISFLRENIPGSVSDFKTKNPVPYFQLLLACVHFIRQNTITKRIWFNSHEYLAVLNTTEKYEELFGSKGKISSCIFCYILCGVISAQSLISLVVGYSFVHPISTLTPKLWLQRLLALSQYNFWLVGRQQKPGETLELSEVTFMHGVLMILTLLGEWRRLLLYQSCDTGLLMAVLTLWIPARSFSESIVVALRNDKNIFLKEKEKYETGDMTTKMFHHVRKIERDSQSFQQWPKLYKSFLNIYSISHVVNVSLGTSITWYLAEGMIFYSSKINYILFADEFRRIIMIIYYILTGVILYLSADISYQLETLRCWLVQRNDNQIVDCDEANLALHVLNSTDVGIRASNLITLTYPIIAGYLSLIITFFLISLQQSDEHHELGMFQ